MAQAIRFYIPSPNETSFSVIDSYHDTGQAVERLRRNPVRLTRGLQVFQINTHRLLFRYHFILPTWPPIESFPPNVLIPGYIPIIVSTPSLDSDPTIESYRVYTLVQFPTQIFELHLLPAGAA